MSWDWTRAYAHDEPKYKWRHWFERPINPVPGETYLALLWYDPDQVCVTIQYVPKGPKLALEWQLRKWDAYHQDWKVVEVPSEAHPLVYLYLETHGIPRDWLPT